MQLLPFTSDPAQTFSVSLDGSGYKITARYNDLAGYWTFDLARTSDSVVLVSEVPILIGQDLLEPYALQIGAIIAVDSSRTGVDAGPDDLNDRVLVYWYSEDDKASLASFLRRAGVPL
jgi:hypothetical protein